MPLRGMSPTEPGVRLFRTGLFAKQIVHYLSP